jgi:ubiquinone/menaquinone biosynthesis C-methylase UbiE
MTLPGVRVAYDASASDWLSGPVQVYSRLAEALVRRSPVPLAGSSVLDVGAGTGVAGRVARAAGARRVVAADVAVEMLRLGDRSSTPVVADARALPFADSSFDLIVAACSLSHVPDPVRALREMKRVAPTVLISAFRSGWTHPAKAVVDDVLAQFGYRVPAWYLALKREVEPAVDDVTSLTRLVTDAGYREPMLDVVEVTTGLRTPAQLAEWRMGMAHLAPFVAGLAPETRAAALVDPPPLVISLVVLAAG